MRDFQSLFRGREDAHGKYHSVKGRKATDRGKIVSKAESLHEPLTPELYQRHLAGEERLGVIPVRADGKCLWFVIDVDFYKIGKKKLADVGGYEKIAKAINDIGAKLVVTRSKSGGAHLWGFLEEPMPAKAAYEAAVELKKRLKLADVLEIEPKEFDSHVDIFPKDFSPDNIGSWVNLPYFGDVCHCVGEDGKGDLSLPEFIAYASERLYHPDDLKFKAIAVKKQGPISKEKDMPPCIEHMLNEGVPEGHRNDAVTQFAIFALKAYPDDWQEKVHEFNEQACNPPMRKDEVAPILKSVGSKKYEGYLCNKIKDIFCDKDACKKRTYGVGQGGAAPIDDIGITHMEKIDGEEPIYLVKFGEQKPFAVGVVDLYLYANFRKKAMAALNRLIPNLKQPDWEDILQGHLELMEVTEAAEDTQMRDRVIKQFQHWCSQATVTDDLDSAMEANCPFYDGKVIVFSGDAFLSQIDRQLRIERDAAYIYLRGWGVVMIERTVKGKKVKLWCYVQNGPLWFDPYKGKQK